MHKFSFLLTCDEKCKLNSCFISFCFCLCVVPPAVQRSVGNQEGSLSKVL